MQAFRRLLRNPSLTGRLCAISEENPGNITEHGRGKVADLASVKAINGLAYLAEINEEVSRLEQEFADQLSLRLDLRTYQDLSVEIDGASHPLSSLAQLRLKNPTFLEIVVSQPDYAKPIKDALEASGMNVSPYIERGSVMVPLPRVTRQRREELGRKAHELAVRAADRIRKIHKAYDNKLRTARDTGLAPADEAEEALLAILTEQRSAIEKTKVMATDMAARLLKESV